MRKLSIALVTAIALGAVFTTASADQPAKADDSAKSKGKPAEGLAVFQKYKCRSCHSIESQGITKKEIEGETEKTEKKPPDLSGVGLEKKADWFALFLQKKEKLEDTLHPKKFRGTETELKKLTAWLETLKEKPAASKEKAKEKGEEKEKAEEKEEAGEK